MTRNVAFIKEWIAALRSGLYEQGTQLLRSSENRYCCFGVACDLKDNSFWEERKNHFVWHSSGGSPPTCLLEAIGLTRKEADDLVDMNDIVKKNFNEIADYLETLIHEDTKGV